MFEYGFFSHCYLKITTFPAWSWCQKFQTVGYIKLIWSLIVTCLSKLKVYRKHNIASDFHIHVCVVKVYFSGLMFFACQQISHSAQQVLTVCEDLCPLPKWKSSISIYSCSYDNRCHTFHIFAHYVFDSMGRLLSIT